LSVSLKRRASWTRNTIDLALLAKLRRVEQLKLDEIAGRMDVCRSTVDQRIKLIRAKDGG
jgi:predicted DNA-binding protein (UPF0251 family)